MKFYSGYRKAVLSRIAGIYFDIVVRLFCSHIYKIKVKKRTVHLYGHIDKLTYTEKILCAF